MYQRVCAVCHMLEDEKCENVSLRKMVKWLKQQLQDTRTLQCTDLTYTESSLTSEQQQQLAGDCIMFLINVIIEYVA